MRGSGTNTLSYRGLIFCSHRQNERARLPVVDSVSIIHYFKTQRDVYVLIFSCPKSDSAGFHAHSFEKPPVSFTNVSVLENLDTFHFSQSQEDQRTQNKTKLQGFKTHKCKKASQVPRHKMWNSLVRVQDQ